jgi:hypothetical protein
MSVRVQRNSVLVENANEIIPIGKVIQSTSDDRYKLHQRPPQTNFMFQQVEGNEIDL